VIHRSVTKSGRPGLTTITAPVPCDADGVIRNGYPAALYLPKDPGRRERLLILLGMKESS
jgi:hypothetical protein